MDLVRPYTMLVSGQSGCGKTHWVTRLVEETKHLYDNVILAYTMYQADYEKLGVTLVYGMPSDVPPNTLLILDDMMFDCNKTMAELFTKMRHASISTIFIVQHMFFDNKFLRTISRNAHYHVLFPNPRDAGMIHRLATQIYPAKPTFITSAFDQATSVPFGYLFLDLKPNVKHRIKTGVLQNEEPCVFLCHDQLANSSIPHHT